ncbi:MAG: sulfite exporter TauE/SafE family protein [Methylophilales bacterium]|nr:sulfite exporter TauE/SafE family protein [Methylophilales bacterium]
MSYFALYLATGAFAGLLAGLLGVGGGLVIVPILAWILAAQGIVSSHIMHLAIGTSLATIIPTAISSLRAHHTRGTVDWPLVQRITPGIAMGCLVGAWFAARLETEALKIILAIFQFYVGTQLLLGFTPNPSRGLPENLGVTLAGSLIGAFSSLIGIGGGTLSVPWMVWCNKDMRLAVGTASAIGLPIAIFGSAGFIFNGLSISALPAHSLGFVYLPALAGITLASIFTAPLGAALTHRLPADTLKKLFAILLYALGTKVLLTTI